MPRKQKSKQTSALNKKLRNYNHIILDRFQNDKSDSTSTCSATSTETASQGSSSSSLGPTFASTGGPPINKMIMKFTKKCYQFVGEPIFIPFEKPPTKKDELRRAFIESMAWACASKDVVNRGLNVTAAAVESCDDGKSILWLAANRGVSKDILSYAEEIISMIKSFSIGVRKRPFAANGSTSYAYGLHSKSRSTYQQSSERNLTLLVQKLIRLKGKHMDERRESLCTSIDNLINTLKKELTKSEAAPSIPDIIFWLTTLRETIHSMRSDKMVEYLYRCRSDETYLKIHEEFTLVKLSELESFSFHLYDFGKSLHVAQILQNAANTLDFLKGDVSVRAYGTSQYMSKRVHARRKPVVHAEIHLVELFCRSEKRLLEDDDYVGCSKPACLCCHLYIENVVNPLRKRNFEVRQAHDKIYPWLFPKADLSKALPNMTALDSCYLSKSYEILNQKFANITEKDEKGLLTKKSYKDDPVGLPRSRFDENLKYTG